MKLVIYRDKNTNGIKNYHGLNSHCTEEALKSYNANEKYDTMAEFVELEEGSIAHYFYNLKTKEIKSEKEELQDLQDTLDRISNEIDHRLYNFDHLLEEKIREAKQQAVEEFADKIEKLCTEHEKRYSHLCKSQKECHDETCRYQAILRLHNEITELYGADK